MSDTTKKRAPRASRPTSTTKTTTSAPQPQHDAKTPEAAGPAQATRTKPRPARAVPAPNEPPPAPAPVLASADKTPEQKVAPARRRAKAAPPAEAVAKPARRSAKTAEPAATPKVATSKAPRRKGALPAVLEAAKAIVASAKGPAHAAGAPPPMPAETRSPAVVAAPGPGLNVLIVASEAAPFARTGGLADITGGLPTALAELGHRTTIVLPMYRGMDVPSVELMRVPVRFGSHAEEAICHEAALGTGARAVLVEHAGFFDRANLYGEGQEDYADNPRRFAFLCRAALELAAREGQRVDVLHAHDWQTALAPVLLRTEFAGVTALAGTASVLTIHDASFQGLCAPEWLPMLGMPADLYRVDGLEYWGQVSFLKGGILFSDFVVTLGTRYAEALRSGTRPSGLEGLFAEKGSALLGLLDDEAAGGRGTLEEGAWPALARRHAEVFAQAVATRAAAQPPVGLAR